VVIYEIVTEAIPWAQCSNIEAANKVLDEERMEIPLQCPEILSRLMKQCWRHDPANRPEFTELCDMLAASLSRDLNSFYDLSPVSK